MGAAPKSVMAESMRGQAVGGRHGYNYYNGPHILGTNLPAFVPGGVR